MLLTLIRNKSNSINFLTTEAMPCKETSSAEKNFRLAEVYSFLSTLWLLTVQHLISFLINWCVKVNKPGYT